MAVTALENEALQWASSDEGLLVLIGRLLEAEAPEHPLSQRLFLAIKAYVFHKRRLRRWAGGWGTIPSGGSVGTEALRHNVQLLLDEIQRDLGHEATTQLTHEMGECLNGRMVINRLNQLGASR